MSPNHPNARLLDRYYRGIAALEADTELSPDERQQQSARIQSELLTLLTEDFAIHTAGVRLAATGGIALAAAMGRRRAELSHGSFSAVRIDSIVADDHYAVVSGHFRAERDGAVIDFAGLGVWRFVDGTPTEHWEMAPGPEWDRFFLDGDPAFTDGTAEEFWFGRN